MSDEANLIRQQFATLYELIQKETSRTVSDLSSQADHCQLTNMPANFNLSNAIQGWKIDWNLIETNPRCTTRTGDNPTSR